MADLPGSLELLLILFVEILETVEIFGILKGFLDVFDNLGSDTAPMTPRTVVGVLTHGIDEIAYMRDAYNEVLPLKSTRVL